MRFHWNPQATQSVFTAIKYSSQKWWQDTIAIISTQHIGYVEQVPIQSHNSNILAPFVHEGTPNTNRRKMWTSTEPQNFWLCCCSAWRYARAVVHTACGSSQPISDLTQDPFDKMEPRASIAWITKILRPGT